MRETTVKVPAELFALAESSRFEGSYPLNALSIGCDDYRFDEPLEWSVMLTNTGSAILVEGEVLGFGVCPCARCLEDAPHAFAGQVEGYFLLSGEGAAADEDAEDDEVEGEFDVLPDDHLLDLADLLDAALAMDAPDKPLCAPDCAGLCAKCGANLNEGPCSCAQDAPDVDFERLKNPFSALADFKFD